MPFVPVMVMSSQGVWPVTTLRSVVLPQPFAPVSAARLCPSSVNDTFFRTSLSPNDRHRFLTWSVTMVTTLAIVSACLQ